MAIAFAFTSPAGPHAVHAPNGALIAEFVRGPGRRATHGVFATTDLHQAVRLDLVAADHGVVRAPMSEESVQLLDKTKQAIAKKEFALPPLPGPGDPPAGSPAPPDPEKTARGSGKGDPKPDGADK